MKTECTPAPLEFTGLGSRRAVGAFDGAPISSDGGAVLLREVDALLGLAQKFAACFTDRRNPDLIEHDLAALLRQRVYGLALGYEDLNDHDDLKRDPSAVGVGAGEAGSGRQGASPRGGPGQGLGVVERIEPLGIDGCGRGFEKPVQKDRA